MDQAWELYRQSEFRRALGAFQKLTLKYPPKSEAYLQGLYGEASVWNHRRDGRDPAKAIDGYQAILNLAPDHPLAAWAALDQVRVHHLAPADEPLDYPKLTHEYAGVAQKYAGTPAGQEAFLYEIWLSLPASNQEESLALLEKIESFLNENPAALFRSSLYEAAAECAGSLGQSNRRLEFLAKAIATREIDPNNPQIDLSTSYWNLAYSAEFEAGNFKLAREYYTRFLNAYPRDIRVFAVHKALARMDAVESAVREGHNALPAQ